MWTFVLLTAFVDDETNAGQQGYLFSIPVKGKAKGLELSLELEFLISAPTLKAIDPVVAAVSFACILARH